LYYVVWHSMLTPLTAVPDVENFCGSIVRNMVIDFSPDDCGSRGGEIVGMG